MFAALVAAAYPFLYVSRLIAAAALPLGAPLVLVAELGAHIPGLRLSRTMASAERSRLIRETCAVLAGAAILVLVWQKISE